MNEAMIKITDLRKSYGNLDVLKGIDLTIAEREVVVIIGPSGSGKSTLLRCINYLEEPTGGSIVIDGIPLTGEANINEIRKEVGMVFQRFNLFPHMTVLENLVLAPMKVRGISRSEAEQTAQELLIKVGLDDKANAYPDQLSGGHRRGGRGPEQSAGAEVDAPPGRVEDAERRRVGSAGGDHRRLRPEAGLP